MTTAIERLERLLDEKDAEIDNLDAKVEQLERMCDGSKWGWAIPRELGDEYAEDGLPLPRLEFVYHKDPEVGWSRMRVDLLLVTRHFLGHMHGIPLGCTRSDRGGDAREEPMRSNGQPDLPFRDSAHAAHDAALLGLSVYARLPGRKPILCDMSGWDNAVAQGKASRRP